MRIFSYGTMRVVCAMAAVAKALAVVMVLQEITSSAQAAPCNLARAVLDHVSSAQVCVSRLRAVLSL